jgi:hypothetical protein
LYFELESKNHMPKLLTAFLCLAASISVLGCGGGAVSGSSSGLPLYVTAHGEGATKDAAVNDAFRDAIQRSAGVLINSQLVQQNGKITQDLLQEYSSAYITSYEVIQQGRAKSGLYGVDIAANVSSTKLAARLGDYGKKGSASTPKGEQIYAQVSTQIKSRTQGDAFLQNIIEEFPHGAFKVSVGSVKPSITSIREIVLNVPVEVRWSRSYLNALKQTIRYVAVDSCVALNDRQPACNYQIAFHNPGILGFSTTQAYMLADDVQGRIVTQQLNPMSVLVLNFYGEDDKALARMCSYLDMSSINQVISGSLKVSEPLMSRIRGVEIYERTFKSNRSIIFDNAKDIELIKRIDGEVMRMCPAGGSF